MKGLTSGRSQQAIEAGSSLTLETRGWAGAAPTKPERARTARRSGSGEQDGKVYVRNQRWNPLKREDPAQTWRIWAGRQCTLVRIRGVSDFDVGVSFAGSKATRKACRVLVARLQGKSWAPNPSTGCVVNVRPLGR
jgi:hypothetical protein